MDTRTYRLQTLAPEHIERDPSLATEANLTFLLESLIEVHEDDHELGGYDSNFQSYYDRCYLVTRNVTAFEAIRTIAKLNPAAFSHRNRQSLREIGQRSLASQVTTSTPLDPGTTYLGMDDESIRLAKQERSLILKEVEDLFGI